MSEGDDDLFSIILPNTKDYFSENNYLTQDKLDDFLSQVGLLEIWNDDDYKLLIWETFQKYSKSQTEIDSEAVINGLRELLTGGEGAETSTTDKASDNQKISDEYTNNNNSTASQKGSQKDIIMKSLSLMPVDKLAELRKAFSFLNLNAKEYISIEQIKKSLSEYSIIKVNEDELIKFIYQVTSDYSRENPDLIKLNFELYSEAISYIEQKILTSHNESSVQDSIFNETEENPSDPIELLDDLISLEADIDQYMVMLEKIKGSLSGFPDNFEENYRNFTKKNTERGSTSNKLLETYKDDLSNTKNNFLSKLNDINVFIKEIRSNSEKKKNKLEFFKNLLFSQFEKIRSLEDYQTLYEEAIQKKTVDNDELIDKLKEEIDLVKEQVAQKENKINKYRDELKEKEGAYNAIELKYNESYHKEEKLKQDLARIKEDNEQLRKNYQNLLTMFEKVNQVEEKEPKRVVDSGYMSTYCDNKTEKEQEVVKKIMSKGVLSTKQKEICKMDYEKLINYAFTLNSGNEMLQKQITTNTQKIKEIESRLEQTNKLLQTEKENNLLLTSENNRIMSKCQDLEKEAELNMLFRPSNALERMSRVSRVSNVNNNNIANIFSNKNTNRMLKANKLGDNIEENENIKINKLGDNIEENEKIRNKRLGGNFEGNENIKNKRLGGNFEGNENIKSNKLGGNFEGNEKIKGNRQGRNMARNKHGNAFKTGENNEDDENYDDDMYSPRIRDNSDEEGDTNNPFNRKKQKYNDDEEEDENMDGNFLRESEVDSPRETIEIEQSEAPEFSKFQGKKKPNDIDSFFDAASSNFDVNIFSDTPSGNASGFKGTDLSITGNNLVIDEKKIAHMRGKTIDDLGKVLKEEVKLVNSSDFLTIRKNQKILKLLEDTDDSTNSYEMFSDNVFVKESANKKVKRVIFITCESIYIMKPDDFKVLQRFERKLLKKFTISKKNCNLIVFHFQKGNDLVIEILRRLELLYYFRDLYKLRKFGKIAFKYSDEFNIKKDGYYVSVSVNVSKDTIAQNFRGAIKLGDLTKVDEGFLKNHYKGKFAVLCSIGLLYFDDPKGAPKKLIPIIGSEIKRAKDKNNKYCFEINTMNKEHIVFGTTTEEDLMDWLKEFDKMKKQYNDDLTGIDFKGVNKKGK